MAVSTTNRWKLGLFVVLALAIGAFSLVWLGASSFTQDRRSAVSYFDESVQGLDVGSAVKFRGVPIGSVSKIAIGPDLRHVEVTSEIDAVVLRSLGFPSGRPTQVLDARGVSELRVQLASAGITGVKFLQVDFFDTKRFAEYLPEGEDLILERGPLEGLARDGEMVAYRHEGFWQCMDTYREWKILSDLWNAGDPPWALWR